MRIGGVLHFTLIDFPGRIACVVFTIGCTFRCPYCYNRDLVLGRVEETSEEHFLRWLESRRGKIEGVVVTGGEPTTQNDLPAFLRKVKEMGFDVKLDTNGSNPSMLRNIISEGLVDYIAMDVKSPLEKERFIRVTGVQDANVMIESVKRSISIVMEGNVPYEFRTTVVPTLILERDIRKIGRAIRGAKLWVLQGFRPEETLIDPRLREVKPYPPHIMQRFAEIARDYVNAVQLRGV